MSGARRALLVGIDAYRTFPPLYGSVDDARAMGEVLSTHADGSRNFSCELLVGDDNGLVDRRTLRKKWLELFTAFDGDILFYFAGHGMLSPVGGFLATQDGEPGDPGLPMDELLNLANSSVEANSVLIILDCCHSGSLGALTAMQLGRSAPEVSLLSQGVTVLAASRSDQTAAEDFGGGVFTQLVVAALQGGAADLRGQVSAASIYAYVEQALGAWDQRPLYKTNARRLHPVRRCEPKLTDDELRALIRPELFPSIDHRHLMDPSYEHSRPEAKPENVAKFDYFKRLRDAGLLDTGGKDLYYLAVGNPEVTEGGIPEPRGGVSLTALGQFYWRLVKGGRI